MGFALPNGAHVYLASGYGPAITFTGATNAEHAVITVSAADDIAIGDIVHVNCNWSGIDNVIAKIDAIAENAVTLRNINTTNKNKYAAGGGSGSIRKIEEWTELPQITEVSKSGGDQNTTQIQFLSDDRQRNLNTYKSAVSQTYSIAHDSTLPVSEDGFAWCGCGTANTEAEGIKISRVDVGVYVLRGSAGLASEGWQLLPPMDPGGMGELGIVEAEQAESGGLTIRLFKRKYMLSDEGEIVKTKGEPMDVPVNSWIDVRLDMPDDSAFNQMINQKLQP